MTSEVFARIVSPLAETLVVAGPLVADRRDYPHFLFAINEGEIDGSVRFVDGSLCDVPHQTGALFYVQADGTNQLLLGSPFSLVDDTPAE